jgi:hypothetical protein
MDLFLEILWILSASSTTVFAFLMIEAVRNSLSTASCYLSREFLLFSASIILRYNLGCHTYHSDTRNFVSDFCDPQGNTWSACKGRHYPWIPAKMLGLSNRYWIEFGVSLLLVTYWLGKTAIWIEASLDRRYTLTLSLSLSLVCSREACTKDWKNLVGSTICRRESFNLALLPLNLHVDSTLFY